ncbi:uncharacterized protein SCDLUD_001714 [Saccharomycodes ludwigii]|uniref:uncharacterized protein n=1 Tax=Saccharomycodes ludwigii TaxID=36035 RepID=UPI001E8BE8C5|nr:hypothetical protein SCDLUD_001714 [Saccharomycodes ludwigii]KAH3901929.1 hypothetical protein SCDLUD_001714 [Saccharomycodes ludwigii]
MKFTKSRLIAFTPGKIRSVAVIGAGPVGSGLTKALINENHFDKIDVFEKRSRFGGLWNYTKPITLQNISNDTSIPCVPCENPAIRIKPQMLPNGEKIFGTAVYKYLDTNVPKQLMEYHNFPFKDGTPLFPIRDQVLQYLTSYAKPIQKYVQFNTEVSQVHYNDANNKYIVKVGKLGIDGDVESHHKNLETAGEYDAVAIATGFYDLPYIPTKPGLDKWYAAHPSSISHAKDFDCPEQYEHLKGEIVVVGNSASGSDLAFELAVHLKKPIYKSKRSENILPAGKSEYIKEVGDIAGMDPSTKTIIFTDGTKLSNVEKIIFCTGYLKSLPFLPKQQDIKDPTAQVGDTILSQLITNGGMVHNLFNHIVPINLPSFGIIGLPKYVLPTRLSETQGAWLARIWSGRIQLPDLKKRQAYHDWFAYENGLGGKFHDLVFPRDIQYSQRLNKEIKAAGNGGYFGVEWSPEQIRLRASIKPLKEAYLEKLKVEGKRALSIDELIAGGYFKWPEDAISVVQVPNFAP